MKSFHISMLFSLCHLMPYYKNMNHWHFNQVMRLLFTSVAFPRVKAKRQTAAFLWGLFVRHRAFCPSIAQQHLHHQLHPLIILPLCCITGFRATQWFQHLARYELLQWSTRPSTFRRCQRLFTTRTFLKLLSFLPLIRLLFDTWYEPLELLVGTGKGPPTFFPSPCRSASLWLFYSQFLPHCSDCLTHAPGLELLSSVVSGSRPSGTGQAQEHSLSSSQHHS